MFHTVAAAFLALRYMTTERTAHGWHWAALSSLHHLQGCGVRYARNLSLTFQAGMPYIIETFDKPNSLAMRKENRDAHLQFLDENKAALIACGAKLNDDGSDQGGGLYIVAVESAEEARAFIEQDPFFKIGLFGDIKITRWRKAYVDGVCKL